MNQITGRVLRTIFLVGVIVFCAGVADAQTNSKSDSVQLDLVIRDATVVDVFKKDVVMPFVLRRLGFDPATSSAPFVATLVDVTGLVIYFSVAFVVLRGILL
jgi:Mg/Co/Ni transporter MgtE